MKVYIFIYVIHDAFWSLKGKHVFGNSLHGRTSNVVLSRQRLNTSKTWFYLWNKKGKFEARCPAKLCVGLSISPSNTCYWSWPSYMNIPYLRICSFAWLQDSSSNLKTYLLSINYLINLSPPQSSSMFISLLISNSKSVCGTDSCARSVYDNGVGNSVISVGVCPAGSYLSGELCYPACPDGYYAVGPVCWQRCASGYTDIGALCQGDSYGKVRSLQQLCFAPFSTSLSRLNLT